MNRFFFFFFYRNLYFKRYGNCDKQKYIRSISVCIH